MCIPKDEDQHGQIRKGGGSQCPQGVVRGAVDQQGGNGEGTHLRGDQREQNEIVDPYESNRDQQGSVRRIDDLGRDFAISHKADIDPDHPLEFVCAETTVLCV